MGKGESAGLKKVLLENVKVSFENTYKTSF